MICFFSAVVNCLILSGFLALLFFTNPQKKKKTRKNKGGTIFGAQLNYQLRYKFLFMMA